MRYKMMTITIQTGRKLLCTDVLRLYDQGYTNNYYQWIVTHIIYVCMCDFSKMQQKLKNAPQWNARRMVPSNAAAKVTAVPSCAAARRWIQCAQVHVNVPVNTVKIAIPVRYRNFIIITIIMYICICICVVTAYSHIKETVWRRWQWWFI